MKLTIFLFFFLLLPLNAFAQGAYPWDPIYVEVQPTQQTKNQQTRDKLKDKYGLSEFYSCYSYSCSGKDTSFPNTEAMCLNATEYCLESKQLSKDLAKSLIDGQKKAKESFTCSAGYTLDEKSMTCTLDKDKVCKNNYGQYSYYTGQENDKKEYICGCISGYEYKNYSCVLKVDESALNDKPIRILKSIDFLLNNASNKSTNESVAKTYKGKIIKARNGAVWHVNVQSLKRLLLDVSSISFKNVKDEAVVIQGLEAKKIRSNNQKDKAALAKKYNGKFVLDKLGYIWFSDGKTLYNLGKNKFSKKQLDQLAVVISDNDLNKITVDFK